MAVHGLSLATGSRSYSSLQCAGFSLGWLLLWQSTGSRCVGSVVVTQDLVTPWHAESSRTRDRTRVPCIVRQTPIH